MSCVTAPATPSCDALGRATGALATYAAETPAEDFPDEVTAWVVDVVMDSVGCGLAGARSELGSMVSGHARTVGSGGRCSLLGSNERIAPLEAAFANAHLINALDFDDTDQTGHPGASVVAAALAATEITGRSGRAFLAAIAVGEKVAHRVGAAIKPSWDRYRQVHGSAGPVTVGVAAAAGRLFGLGVDEMTNALALAGALAPVPHAGKFGWEQRPLASIKDNVGQAAASGLRAAFLAAQGFRGDQTMFDGPRGFWVMAGSDAYEPAKLTDALCAWDTSQHSFKPYPCCRWIHTTLDALNTPGFLSEESLPESIEVRTILPLAEAFAVSDPASMVDAQFSVPHAVACHILGVPKADWSAPATRASVAVRSLARRVHIVPDNDCQHRYLELGRLSWRIPSAVSVTSSDGDAKRAYCDAALGSSDNPLSEAELTEKFIGLAAPSLGTSAANQLEQTIRGLREAEDVDALLAAVRLESTPARVGER